jgi:hypothetical protein
MDVLQPLLGVVTSHVLQDIAVAISSRDKLVAATYHAAQPAHTTLVVIILEVVVNRAEAWRHDDDECGAARVEAERR